MRKTLTEHITAIEDPYQDDENIIIAHAIVSDEVLGFLYSKYKAGQIKTKHFTKYVQIIFKWLLSYYKDYEKAPVQHIEHILQTNKKILGKDNYTIINEIIDSVKVEYDWNVKEINPQYLIKEIIPRFVKIRETENLKLQLETNLERSDLENIDKSISNYIKLSGDEDPDLGTAIPGSLLQVKKYYTEEKDKGVLFYYPGAIGQLIGPIYRGKLYAITGIEKAGKTYFMQELAYYAAQYHKIKVLDINLEMPIEDKEERFWQRATCMALDDDHAGKLLTPIFDCENNQFGTCQVRKKKLNKTDLLKTVESYVYFHDRKDWEVCQQCRNDNKKRLNAHKNKKFIPAIWYKENRIKVMNERRLTRRIKQLETMGIMNYRIKCFPRFSATLDEIISYINQYSRNKKFKPDLLIIDYPDVTAPVIGKLMERPQIDYNWKRIAGLAPELNCAIMVADQATKAERNKRSLTNMCTSESKTKDAHLDVRLTLNQTDTEFDVGVQRVGMLFRRKGKLIHGEVMITQRRETGNVILDSEWWPNNNIYYPCLKEMN